jgi:hypothetical protein
MIEDARANPDTMTLYQTDCFSQKLRTSLNAGFNGAQPAVGRDMEPKYEFGKILAARFIAARFITVGTKEHELNKTELFCGKRGCAALPTKKFWVLFNP